MGNRLTNVRNGDWNMKSQFIRSVPNGPDYEIRMSVLAVDDHYDALIEVFRANRFGPPIRAQSVRISSRQLNPVANFIRQVRDWNPANQR